MVEFICVAGGIVIGMLGCGLLMLVFGREKPLGTLRIDTSDPDDGPYLFLELSCDPRLIMSQKTVLLKVNTESYLSQG